MLMILVLQVINAALGLGKFLPVITFYKYYFKMKFWLATVNLIG